VKETIYIWMLVIIFGVGLGAWIYTGYVIVDVMEIPMDIKVMNKVGLNADVDALHFGKNFQGGTGTRRITIRNTINDDIRVSISNEGNFSSWISLSDNHFTLGPGENLTVFYSVDVPVDAQFGEYSGVSKVVLRRKL
jgi:hypothetical protein